MKNEKRAGSALVVVLGMLAVLMVMAVAFSVFMRTERAGTTNLRHSIVAKQTMQTAISQVMESIDRSFEHQTNTWPVPAWPAGVLSSSSDRDGNYYHSKVLLNDGDAPNLKARLQNARVLNPEIRRHLSPAQLALAENAKVEWVPIYGGISPSNLGASEPGKKQPRPVEDDVVGRYAFIALNTTGLLDMNHYEPTNPNTDPINGLDFANEYEVLNFVKTRGESGMFTSYADMTKILLGTKYEDYAYDYENVEDDFIMRDLFGTSYMSVEERAPDGTMKVPLMNPADAKDKNAYIRSIHDAFKKVFEESDDEYTFWKNNSGGLPELTRAQLATIALLDYMDEDHTSCGADVAAALAGADPIKKASVNPLDYPSTEPVPQFTGFYAFFKFPKKSGALHNPTYSGTDSTSGLMFREWDVGFYLYATVASLSDSRIGDDFKAEVAVDFSMVADGINELFGSDWQRVNPGNQFQPVAGIKQVKFEAPLYKALYDTNYEPHVVSAMGDNMTLFGLELEKIMTVREYYNPDDTAGTPKMTEWEVSSPNKDLLSDVRISARIMKGAETVTQIPAPILNNPDKRYLVKISPGLYRPGLDNLEWGWAMVTDPRFGYNTINIAEGLFPGNSYSIWLNNELARAIIGQGTMSPDLVNICTALCSIEEGDTDDAGAIVYPGQGNYLIDLWLTSNQNNAKNRTDEISSGAGIYPDTLLSYKSGAAPYSISGDQHPFYLFTRVANKPMESVGELGRLMIGPWETFSLFANFRPDGSKIHHRVIDYFHVPKEDAGDPWAAYLAGEELPVPGKLNLNAPREVLCVKDSELGVIITNAPPYFNPDPLAVMLTGIKLSEDNATASTLSAGGAREIAAAFYDEAEFTRYWNETDFGDKDEEDIRLGGMPMATRLSDIGNSSPTNSPNGGRSPIPHKLITGSDRGKTFCDAHREATIANIVENLTVRGQTFTVIIRADAYSMSRSSDRATGGTPLSTTRAIVELWRDPQPVRDSKGNILPDTNNATHNWHVRSVRWF